MFAGHGARSADLEALQRARRMAGHDSREIWDTTGWFVGVDGRWRWEIDDSAAVITSYSCWDRAPRVLYHPELYAAYEAARDAVVRIWLRPGSEPAGICRPGMKATAVHCARNAEIFLVCDTAASARAAALHELQHAIQDLEGFAPGGSRDAAGWESYLCSAGEAEARAVEKRMELTGAQRRAVFPLDSYDVPLSCLKVPSAVLGHRRAATHPAPADRGEHETRGPAA